jgi:hypothetical protein
MVLPFFVYSFVDLYTIKRLKKKTLSRKQSFYEYSIRFADACGMKQAFLLQTVRPYENFF